MTSALPTLIDHICRTDWAMKSDILNQLVFVVNRHCSGVKLAEDQVADIVAARGEKKKEDRQYHVTAEGTAIIPVSGIIAKHASMVNGASQARGTSIEQLREQFSQAVNDRFVNCVMLQIESPGGCIDGLADFAGDVFRARGQKPILAYADDLCASAAYWIASQADAIYANQTADVGSIGVYSVYVDSSQRAEDMGLKFHIFRSGANKGVGASGVPITDENCQVIQERVTEKFEIFLNAIMRGRAGRIEEEQLRALADGRCYVGQTALKNNLIDGICDFQQALEIAKQMGEGTISVTAGAASAEEKSNIEKESIMKDAVNKDAAAEETKEQQVDIAAVKAAERQRITGIEAALTGDELAEVRAKAIDQDMTVEQAKAAAFDQLKAASETKVKDLSGQLEESQSRLKAIAEGGSDLSAQPVTDDQSRETSADSEEPKAFEAAREKHLAAGKSQAQAIRLAAKEYPKSHLAWTNQGRTAK